MGNAGEQHESTNDISGGKQKWPIQIDHSLTKSRWLPEAAEALVKPYANALPKEAHIPFLPIPAQLIEHKGSKKHAEPSGEG